MKKIASKNLERYYWDETGFSAALSSYQTQMINPDLSASATIPDIIVDQLSSLSEHMLQSHKFCHYNKWDKEDMVSHFWRKAMRALMSYDFTKGSKTYSYFTRVFYCACLDIINKIYDYQNLKNKLSEQYLRSHGCDEQTIKDLCEYQEAGRTDY